MAKRWVIGVDRAACTGCGACVYACEHDALTVGPEFAQVDASRCDGLGPCIYLCPQGALGLEERELAA